MAMSVSPAQMMLQVATMQSEAPAGHATPTPLPGGAQASASAATPTVDSSTESPTPEAAEAPAAQFSTDLRVDAEHQLYYEVVDDSTGDVLFEIPPEALRAIGESMDVTQIGDSSAHSVDVKS